MIVILIVGAGIAFPLWGIARARDDAAERLASGLSRDPLYWVYNALACSVVGMIMYIAKARLGFTDMGRWFWIAAVALLLAALLVRRTLKWRYPL
jgi:hypothetical protein